MLKKNSIVFIIAILCIVTGLMGVYSAKRQHEFRNQPIPINNSQSVNENNEKDESEVNSESEAKKVADEYCDMLKSKQTNIESITYLEGTASDNTFYISYRVEFNTGLTRTGKVTVVKSNNGEYNATGMDFN